MRVFARTSVRLSVFYSAALLLCSLSAKANVIINVVDGSFNDTSFTGSGKLGGTQTLTHWTSTGYSFVFSGTSATNANGQFGNAGGLSLWGVTGGVESTDKKSATGGTPNGIKASPDGGNFLAMDGGFEPGPVSQSLSGLTIGMTTAVSFYYAGAQQTGFDSATTEAFTVSLGTEKHSTAILSDVNHGFTGWQSATLYFTPTATTEVLSFLAVGTPTGQPPFSLLDGISVVQVTPEPSTLALLGTGVLAVGGLWRRRRLSL